MRTLGDHWMQGAVAALAVGGVRALVAAHAVAAAALMQQHRQSQAAWTVQLPHRG